MKVFVTARMPEAVLALIRQEHQVESYAADMPLDRQKLLKSIADKAGLLCTITDRIDTELLACAKALKVIANFGVGFTALFALASLPAFLARRPGPTSRGN